MSQPKSSHPTRGLRLRRGWSQAELAARAGISRTAVSAIEQGRLAPSVNAALALARALDATVEELFGQPAGAQSPEQWAWPPAAADTRYWRAEVAGRRWLYPAESTPIGEIPHDGVTGVPVGADEPQSADRVLVVATCDPAVGLLAAEYARQSPFRLLPLSRSSHAALELLNAGQVHAAGVHLSSSSRGGNAVVVRESCGAGVRLLRVGVWQEGIAFAAHLNLRSPQSALSARLKWVGREPGSGARQCLDELLAGRAAPRRTAPDHRSVALAIRCGWADAGVCLRMAGEQAGLGFLQLRREAYDLCIPDTLAEDPRVRALIDVVRSSRYRQLLNDLPGYDIKTTGNYSAC